MKVLFVHQNFPGQYLHLARHLAADGRNEVVFVTKRRDATLPGVKVIAYEPHRPVTPGVHHYLRETEAAILNAQNVTRVAIDLKSAGFIPDVILAHNGWGELWYLKDVFPDSPLIGYFEFFYRRHGADVGFDPSENLAFDNAPRVRTKNMGNLIGLDAADVGQTATRWQKSLYPSVYQSKLHVVHEGINTAIIKPDSAVRFLIPGTQTELAAGDEVVTYVARNLEPYRGFPNFMRSLPTVLAARPKAHVLIVGGDETSYGPGPADGRPFRAHLLGELAGSLDMSRVHFLGKVPYPTFVNLLQLSKVHVYLTYPFVLSWSMLEAMAAGCLVVGSRTAPVEEVIRDGDNGLLVDFFAPDQIARRVVDVLGDSAAFDVVRQRARRTIVENYDLHTICLPAQLRLLEAARHAMA